MPVGIFLVIAWYACLYNRLLFRIIPGLIFCSICLRNFSALMSNLLKLGRHKAVPSCLTTALLDVLLHLVLISWRHKSWNIVSPVHTFTPVRTFTQESSVTPKWIRSNRCWNRSWTTYYIALQLFFSVRRPYSQLYVITAHREVFRW